MLEQYLDRIDQNIKYMHVTKAVHNIDFHLHAGCEIYFLIHGDVRYFVEKAVYPLQYGDLIITNEHEIHKPSFSSSERYERITIEFDPMMVKAFVTADYDPLACFYNRPQGKRNKLSLTPKETSQLMELFMKYESLDRNRAGGAAVLKLGCMMELLITINDLYHKQKHTSNEMDLHHKLTPILDYIELHLHEDLSLSELERRFFINKYYLLRQFKQYTGSTVHEYIVSKRVSLAKKYLAEGVGVLEACMRCGFNDYSSFLRMFKKKTGVQPKEYQKGVRTGGLAVSDRNL
ncbi:AraC-like DNA-binding protein [Paenibacillus castaneae]|uniref:AraC family transcriptional regulator n=1 Tax=Paenibacillus castaneae TaxID=474957 RepID=UPI000C9D13DE|nr:AraC family transcriptional regulator [Paenibacillus castaneae]NIK75018.1 AraC-like DNA-binding protein [Paenibacillus castaneae]